MEIKTLELEIIFKRIIEKLKTEEVESVNIKEDLYRYISPENWSSYESDIIESGSLFDDIESLKKLANDTNRPCMYVDFDRVASVLYAISQLKNPSSII